VAISLVASLLPASGRLTHLGQTWSVIQSREIMHVRQRQSTGDLEGHLSVRARIKIDQQELPFMFYEFDIKYPAIVQIAEQAFDAAGELGIDGRRFETDAYSHIPRALQQLTGSAHQRRFAG
jgi:hypothetical protein